MRLAARWLLLVTLGFGAPAMVYAQAATLTFDFDFPGEVPPHYSLLLHPDGSGSYLIPTPGKSSVVEFQMEPGATDSWFKQVRALHFFQGKFASKRNVAFSGTKTLRYAGPDGAGETVFNFSQNDQLTQLVSELQQLCQTLQIGHTLEDDLRFHRMALDDDMEALQRMLKSHSASHPEVIASSLQMIASNPEVMQRVSRAAQGMLKAMPTDVATPLTAAQ